MSKAPKTLTQWESVRLLQVLLAKDGTPRQERRGVRNAAIALCMLDAGLRVGEVCRLHKSDLWFNNGPVTSIIVGADVAEKAAERQIPVSARLSGAIQAMHQFYWSDILGFPDHAAFYGDDPRRPVTARQIERIIAAASDRALGRSIHPHVLRHTFASRLMRKTNARIVQVLLGHKNLSSTQIYCHPNQQDLTAAIETLNQPAAQ